MKYIKSRYLKKIKKKRQHSTFSNFKETADFKKNSSKALILAQNLCSNSISFLFLCSAQIPVSQ